MSNDVKYRISLEDDFSGKLKTADKSVSSFEQKIMKVGKAVGGVFAAGALVNLGTKVAKGVIETTSEFEKFEAVLSNTLGSNSEAQKALKQISDFAARTPFQVSELSSSFVKLANQGFRPTVDEMTSLGDLASSTGKSFDQLTEAIIDAQVGEFERLKEFGIRASKSGDKVTFTFKGVQKQVDFTEKSIRDYVLSLGNAAGVSGAMAKISKTTGGQISNLKDSIDQANLALARRFNKSTESAISLTSKLVQGFTDWVDVKLADEIEKERKEVNRLVLSLNDHQKPQEERLAILNKLKEIAPDIAESIKQEGDNYIVSTQALVQYNQQALNRILLAKKQEEIDKFRQKANELGARAEERLIELQDTRANAIFKLSKINQRDAELVQKLLDGTITKETSLNELRQKYGEETLLLLNQAGIQTSETTQDFISAQNIAIKAIARRNGLTADQIGLNEDFYRTMAKYNSLWTRANKLDISANKLGDEKLKLAEALGVKLQENSEILKSGGKPLNVSATPSKELTDGIETIKSAAPKTFNININSLINGDFNLNSQTINEGAVETRETITMALMRAVADVQARA